MIRSGRWRSAKSSSLSNAPPTICPNVYRVVFVARVIEGFSLDETADLLGLRAATVKTRLHRARSLVRKALDARIGPSSWMPFRSPAAAATV